MTDFISVNWDALDDRTTDPLERARAVLAVLDQIPGIQSRLSEIRSNALADLRDLAGSNAEVARMLGISSARVGQLIGDGGRADGIRLGLLKKGLMLSLEYGNRLPPGDDRKITQALAALSRPGRRSEVEAQGIATRLVTIRGSMLDWDGMSVTDKQTLRRALAHGQDVMHRTQPRAAKDSEPDE